MDIQLVWLDLAYLVFLIVGNVHRVFKVSAWIVESGFICRIVPVLVVHNIVYPVTLWDVFLV